MCRYVVPRHTHKTHSKRLIAQGPRPSASKVRSKMNLSKTVMNLSQNGYGHMAVRAWGSLKLHRGALATRAATRFYHMRFSREERFEQGPRAHQLHCRACASAEGEPQTLALSKVALRMFQSAMMLSKLIGRPVAPPHPSPSPPLPMSPPPATDCRGLPRSRKMHAKKVPAKLLQF